MASSVGPEDRVAEARPRLMTRPLLLRFVTVVGSSASFFLLLSVVPVYAQSAPGGGSDKAGLVTGALMLATVVGELIAPWLAARCGYRVMLGAGLLLLGAPALALTVSRSLACVVTVCLVRGLGFAFTLVAGGALTASLIPPERRGEGLALIGVMAGVPSLVGLPLGAWLALHTGYGPVCWAAALIALVSIAAVPGLPGREAASGPLLGIFAGARSGTLGRPTAVFAVTAVGAGIVVTFLPLAVAPGYSGVVAAALFMQPAAATASRWFAGRRADRRGAAGLMVPGLVASAAGILVVALTGVPVAVVVGAAVFGVGFGITQSATITLMYSRVPASGYGTVSALWNVAYDAGMGIGAVGFGTVAGLTGYPWAFVLTAFLMLTALIPARWDLTAARKQRAMGRKDQAVSEEGQP
ncbi:MULTISPECIES: MFS transporter [unclassified Streptomyces]|uniref:MFS transporter n=1 Tax=Streptomyces sp. NBC_00119 TaxID=2975659 RepID=A0AAU1UKT4_9ACTN|nr:MULTISPECIES: MFS transporter [unclassified Streptomyces]MCX4649820.1 MFS transporter [Streptomyces sp. NBC_01446]MCX5320965.1 MFS transporter [Streptomyces sp. NBC_00120]